MQRAWTFGITLGFAVLMLPLVVATRQVGAIDFNPGFIPADYPFSITSGHSGLCWDVRAGVFAIGTPIVQFHCHSGANQRWMLSPASHQRIPDERMIRSVGDSRFCVARSPGNKLVLDSCSAPQLSGGYIEWSFNRRAPGFFAHQINGVNFPDCVDIPNGSFADSIPLQTYECNDGTNQSWLLLPGR